MNVSCASTAFNFSSFAFRLNNFWKLHGSVHTYFNFLFFRCCCLAPRHHFLLGAAVCLIAVATLPFALQLAFIVDADFDAHLYSSTPSFFSAWLLMLVLEVRAAVLRWCLALCYRAEYSAPLDLQLTLIPFHLIRNAREWLRAQWTGRQALDRSLKRAICFIRQMMCIRHVQLCYICILDAIQHAIVGM